MKTKEESAELLVTYQYLDETIEITPDILSYILLLLSAAPSAKMAQEGVRAVGIILKEMVDNNLAKSVRTMVEQTLTPIVTELTQIKEDIQNTTCVKLLPLSFQIFPHCGPSKTMANTILFIFNSF